MRMMLKENVNLKMERQVSLETGHFLSVWSDLSSWLVNVQHVIFINAEPLGAVKNLQVTDPTVNTLRVRWDPADGDVRQYNVLYVPVAGGAESTVKYPSVSSRSFWLVCR